MGLCNDCTNRQSCKTLCPEAATYVNQDYISLTELLVNQDALDNLCRGDVAEAELTAKVAKFYRLPREKQVVTLVALGLDRRKIAQVLGITRKNLRLILYRINKKVNKGIKIPI